MSDSSCQSIIENIDSYNQIEPLISKLIKEAWNNCWAMKDGWRGGSYRDAVLKAGLENEYNVLYETQNRILSELGIERYRDLEGHDHTVDVLTIIKKILLYNPPQRESSIEAVELEGRPGVYRFYDTSHTKVNENGKQESET